MQQARICPVCRGQFSLRDFLRQRACPLCDVSLGFSIPYRLGLAIFSLTIFLYFSYKAVMTSGMFFSIARLILAAPLALVARLLYISNVPPLLTALGVARCPLCRGTLTRVHVRPGPFDCPTCLKRIRPVRSPEYRWARSATAAVLAITAARLKGFDWSFLVFVVSVYAVPVLFFWDIFSMDLWPPIHFEPVQSSVQTLGIGKS